MPEWVIVATCGCILFGYEGDVVSEIADDIMETGEFHPNLDRIICPLHGFDTPRAVARLGNGTCILPEGYGL
jgi:hypothetical protein